MNLEVDAVAVGGGARLAAFNRLGMGMRNWVGAGAVIAACLLFPGSAGAQKLPSARDGYRESALPNGKQNMPFKLYGVAIKWDQACHKGKADQCERKSPDHGDLVARTIAPSTGVAASPAGSAAPF